MKKQLLRLHEEFIDKAARPMDFGKLPVKSVSKGDLPIIAVNKWAKNKEGKLHKKFLFRDQETKREFVMSLMEYEEDVNHNATITITEDSVDVTVYTKDLDVVTELDKEYASAADNIFKDALYSVASDDDARKSK